MTAKEVKNLCRERGLMSLWENLGKAAAAYRPHWHCAGLRYRQNRPMSNKEAADYEVTKAAFEKEAFALFFILRVSVPTFAMAGNVGEIAEAYSR